ncbi:MAG: acetylxylan esterase [Planctomycetota bacterium]
MHHRRCLSLAVLFVPLLAITNTVHAQKFQANYDESKIPDYVLPDPLVTLSGKTVKDAQNWQDVRRPEILRLFEEHVYGVSPEAVAIESNTVSTKPDAIGGKAIRREVDVVIGQGDASVTMGLLIYTPASATGPVPCFIGLNFQGNHTIESDSSLRIPTSWMRDRKNETTDGNRATAAGRGVASSRWPIETIVEQGYGLVTIYYGDIDPDFDDGFENGIHAVFAKWSKSVPDQERWGSIAGWAYGLSRGLDYLETDPLVDAERVAVIGHSRLGKTSLWAGATDPRFKVVISNDSGCGGAALSRRAIGETVGRINTSFPHWFNDRFVEYNENESELPVDQHELIALIAPRPVYVASATKDEWADPKGEFLACVHADPVYRLLGTPGMGGDQAPAEMPDAESPIHSGVIGYHLRTGKHDLTAYDWDQYLLFADQHL